LTYFFIFIFISWVFIYFFVLRKRRGPMEEMRAAEAQMKSAVDFEEKRAAARRVLDIIDRYEMAGIVVDDAYKAAKAILA